MRTCRISRFTYTGPTGNPAVCGIERTDTDDGRVVVVCTELADNPGMSVTNAAERLATLVCQVCGIDPGSLVWVEHYPADDPRTGLRRGKPRWDLVTFKLARAAGVWRFVHPAWRPMTADDRHELGLAPRE